ncbi:MAG: hypothetical protein GYA51_03585 [Candidatus Methanofastidiosa archaeon]|jgi:purine-cytosine permease-like protein|nr:hypothetical protein [Candidatus Methanofastidiosa archaeon]
MALYILKWIVGFIVLAVGVLFGISIIITSPSSSVYLVGGAGMISLAFLVVGIIIIIMGSNEKKKDKEIEMNKRVLSKAEAFSNQRSIDTYRKIRGY